jgi:hypothetical protein
MTNNMTRHNRPVENTLHPWIWGALVALTALFVAGAWGFDLGGNGDAAYLIAIVSGFFVMAVSLPLIAAHIRRKYRDGDDVQDKKVRLRHWLAGDLQTWQHRLKASEAATMIVLPFAAAAIGMVAIAIVLHVVAASSGSV